MVAIYQRTESFFETTPLSKIDDHEKIVWIDILQPNEEEINQIEILFNIKLPTKLDREEIELSSRYWEDSRSIKINSYFFVSFFFVENAKSHYNESVSFVLQDNILFTVRDSELQTFDMMSKMLLSNPKELFSGYDIFMQIFDIRIDRDADLLEYASRESDEIRKKLLWEPDGHTVDLLRKISTMQEFTQKVRQSVFDKRRILTALVKSPKLSQPIKQEISIMMKDLNSLVEFITIDGNTLDNLQNLFLAQTNIEQNKIIKLFTVASVVLMPPTLVASIYGMNFHFMPELDWHIGYPFSLGLMVITGIIPLVYFRKKKWL
ncbi:MAG: magnesium and cobalt transport protein CorA [Sulfuricurvum sp. GWF2_44_89]|uniref:Magnesium transport protein CorA n=1 Tax=Sulfuricurvum kujiense TaxID=148813 RepID=A0A2D3WIA0_9BACT|nr:MULTISPECIES: magnesium/cobalt transporter CorA [Sulfuricurvum]OHD77836.1 MAG: magnesium and cobalt transport protein CorA [Sulfuricurvum sp. GWF2_44_89]OHD92698.1 MAG: magnesium and cobalt transport protein CorA [Sulfuricurvum sp. RIFOXYD2_FULL_44_160]OHD96124.1 MAG: magnesium and cobalt transport protein CorA [Sulfuricurvum sp. RIFOXYD12_FULL_44_77]DAB37444.1 MAG TPA: magnesium and cobalt transport protein CorA [Sulfuricurvum kujiense]